MTPRPPVLPERPKDRFEVYRLFDGISSEGKEGIDQGRTRTPLVKSFLVEHVSSTRGRQTRTPQEIWTRLEGSPHQIDSDFFSIQGTVQDESGARQTTVGYLERYDERFFAYYTTEVSQNAKKRVTKWIQKSPDLDSCWFNSDLLQVLWNRDVSQRGDQRFGKLTFKHESIFEMPENAEDTEEETDDDARSEDSDFEEQPGPERRKARFDMSDRIGRIKQSLGNLQEQYLPLYALYSLRFPSRLGRGSHDLYQHGQLTNRSDSFEDHRSTALYLHQVYKNILESTESKAWSDSETSLKTSTRPHKGVPLIVRFAEPLSEATFKQWISRAFHKKNVFRLWGEPIWMGPKKVHVYGADRHLWQPLNLEITGDGMVAILPKGTCGNTFHRLVTNIQRYVCPKVDAWVGSTPLTDLMSQATGVEG